MLTNGLMSHLLNSFINQVESKRSVQNLDASLSAMDCQEVALSMLNLLARVLRGASSAQVRVSLGRPSACMLIIIKENNLFLDVACCVPSTDLQTLIFLRMLLWEADLSEKEQSEAIPPQTPRSPIFPFGCSPQNILGSHLEWMRACWFPSNSEVRKHQ
jgi:hypothetical protein